MITTEDGCDTCVRACEAALENGNRDESVFDICVFDLPHDTVHMSGACARMRQSFIVGPVDIVAPLRLFRLLLCAHHFLRIPNILSIVVHESMTHIHKFMIRQS